MAQHERTVVKRRLDVLIAEIHERLDVLKGRLEEALEEARERNLVVADVDPTDENGQTGRYQNGIC